MGDSLSAAYDDEVEQEHVKMRMLFEQRARTINYNKVEELTSELFALLYGQQLNRETWKKIEELRQSLTKGTPEDNKLYYKMGYHHYGV
jgi:hypothetical protein